MAIPTQTPLSTRPAAPPTPREHNLAARMARFSARHKVTAILGWLLFVAGVTVLASAIGTISATDTQLGTGESKRADQIIDAAGFPDRAGEMILVRSTGITADDPTFAAGVRDAMAAVRDSGFAENIRSPLDTAELVSADRHAALITFDVIGDEETAGDRIAPVLDAVARVQAAHPDLFIAETGGATIDRDIGTELDRDLQRLSYLSVPISLGILVVAFGALLAAFLPIGLALTAFLGALGLLAVASRWAPTVDTTAHVMLLLGLAVGVDYCLFYIRREREERARGADPERALAVAAATSGRSVLISGLTVIIAMAGLFLTRDTTFVGFAVGTILVVATAVLGSLTVLPALLSTLGDRVDLGRIPGLYRRESNGRAWGTILRVVLRRPAVSAVVAGGALIALAIPALSLRTANPGIDDIRHDLASLQTYDQIQAAFPGGADPARVVIRAPDVSAPEVTSAIERFRAAAVATGQLHEPVDVTVNGDHTVAIVSIGLSGNGSDKATEEAVATLREDVIPATLARIPGAEVAVTGSAAESLDFTRSLGRSMPLVFVFVLGLALVLLLVSFRSLVVAGTAIVLNLLSVAASYGLLVMVFQWGWGERPLGFTANGTITDWMPLFLFVILFGLSMDYHVFVLSRIREGHDRGLSTTDAVARGVRGTAGVITSAALVMVAVFSLFTTMSLKSTKELGIGLAAAVLLDATIVRAVLLPAVMALLGERNWYLPRWLDRLCTFLRGGSATPTLPRNRS